MTKQLAFAVVAGAIFAGGAHAQTRPQPDDPAAPAPPVANSSAFDGYRGYRDESVASWREVNDSAREAGGHVGILRAEQQGGARTSPGETQAGSDRMPAGSHQGKQEK